MECWPGSKVLILKYHDLMSMSTSIYLCTYYPSDQKIKNTRVLITMTNQLSTQPWSWATPPSINNARTMHRASTLAFSGSPPAIYLYAASASIQRPPCLQDDLWPAQHQPRTPLQRSDLSSKEEKTMINAIHDQWRWSIHTNWYAIKHTAMRGRLRVTL